MLIKGLAEKICLLVKRAGVGCRAARPWANTSNNKSEKVTVGVNVGIGFMTGLRCNNCHTLLPENGQDARRITRGLPEHSELPGGGYQRP